MTDLSQNPAFVKYARLVASGEMERAALDTMYASKAVSREAIETAYRFIVAPSPSCVSNRDDIEHVFTDSKNSVMSGIPDITSSDIAVNAFFGDDAADSQELALSSKFSTPANLCSQDESVPMDLQEAREADERVVFLYKEGQRVGNHFVLETYWIYKREGWKRLGFETWENYYSNRFPLLHVKNSYRLMKAQGVRLRLEAIAEDVPKVLQLPEAAVIEIAKLPEEQQVDAAKLTIQLAEEKVIHGDGARYQPKNKENKKPCAMDAKRAVAELLNQPPPVTKPKVRNYKEERLPTDSQLAQIAMKRTVQAQHISIRNSDGTDCILVDMCEEAYKDARVLELPVLVLIALLEERNYVVTHDDPFTAQEEAGE